MKKSSAILLRIIRGIFKATPFPLLDWVGSSVGTFVGFILKERKEIALSNLRIAFPEKSEQERVKIYKKCWKNIGKDMLEAVKYCANGPETVKKRVEIVGKDNLDSCFAQKKGIIASSAHFGNFPLLCLRLAAEGYPVAIIYSPLHNKVLNPMLPALQKEAGLEPIPDMPRHRSVARSLAWLSKGGIQFVLNDQNPQEEAGVLVHFFGKKLPTFRGPIILAMRNRSPILPMFIIREENNHHKVIIEKPLEMKMTGDNEKDVIDNLESLNRVLEKYITEHPSFWWWIHRRFRMAVP
jgi:KDO2-lipid IV(A) lauroyltransferase